MDLERVVWVRVHRVPCDAWCIEFFEHIANSLGTNICVDENTLTGYNMDIAILIVRVPFSFSLKEQLVVAIDGVFYLLVLRKDSYGLVRIPKK